MKEIISPRGHNQQRHSAGGKGGVLQVGCRLLRRRGAQRQRVDAPIFVGLLRQAGAGMQAVSHVLAALLQLQE
jgi:hypothetical protein